MIPTVFSLPARASISHIYCNKKVEGYEASLRPESPPGGSLFSVVFCRRVPLRQGAAMSGVVWHVAYGLEPVNICSMNFSHVELCDRVYLVTLALRRLWMSCPGGCLEEGSGGVQQWQKRFSQISSGEGVRADASTDALGTVEDGAEQSCPRRASA